MKIKVYYENNENDLNTEDDLIKAITFHSNGASHKEDFSDPAARGVVKKMTTKFDKMLEKMLREINKAIDEGIK